MVSHIEPSESSYLWSKLLYLDRLRISDFILYSVLFYVGADFYNKNELINLRWNRRVCVCMRTCVCMLPFAGMMQFKANAFVPSSSELLG
jgi:hypothetical protein